MTEVVASMANEAEGSAGNAVWFGPGLKINLTWLLIAGLAKLRPVIFAFKPVVKVALLLAASTMALIVGSGGPAACGSSV